MRRLTLTALLMAVVAVAAPSAASAATPAQSVGTAIPAPTVITTRIDGVPMTETYDGGGGLPYLGSATSYNAGDWEKNLRAYATPTGDTPSAYEQQIAKVDAVASKWIARSGGRFKLQHRRGHKRGVKVVKMSHARHTHGKRAIVFDVDETALSNYSAIEADNFTFGDRSKAEATDEIGKAIAPSLALYKLAQKKGIATFFITGRKEDVRDHTAHNLQREGFTNYTQLVLKPLDFTGTTVDYKAGARKAIEKQGYRIVASVGDQYSDLAGGHEAVAFKLPNPFYFLP
jgi:predicted secreted acid phosphatase